MIGRKLGVKVFFFFFILLLLSPIYSAITFAQVSASWNIQTVADSAHFGPAAIAVDSEGNPRISYFQDKLAYKEGDSGVIHSYSLKYSGPGASNESIRTIESGAMVYDSSIAVDSKGNSHVVYSVKDASSCIDYLKYAVFSNGKWNIVTIDQNVAKTAKTLSIVLDSQDNPYIVYSKGIFGNLRYATKSGTTWKISTVDQTGSSGCIALDPQGSAHISYIDDFGLKYASWNGTQWEIHLIDPNGHGTTSLAIDSNGYPHISYSGKYASWTGSGWNIQNIGFTGSLALDSNQTPHIAYINGSEVRYASLTSSGWISAYIDHSTTHTIALGIGSNGAPQICYTVVSGYFGHAIDLYSLKYASTTGPLKGLIISDPNPVVISGNGVAATELIWNRQIVTPVNQYENQWGSLVLDTAGYPHIAFTNYTDGSYTLNYAFWTGSEWNLQPTGQYAWDNSLALNSQGNPCISYSSSGTSALCSIKFASWDGSVWVSQIVDQFKSSSNTRLVFDSHGNPHILYDCHDDLSLKYASWTGTAWDIQIIDSNIEWIQGLALALDSNDTPHVCYGGSDDRLMYASWNLLYWDKQQIDTGYNPSLSLDSQNNPHISYCKNDEIYDKMLNYAVWTGSNWNCQTVDESNNIVHSSLAVDSYGNPFISYYCQGTLKFACLAGSSWYIQAVDPYGPDDAAFADFTSIALDSNGNPHISYHDEKNAFIKYATADIHSIPQLIEAQKTTETSNQSNSSLIIGVLVAGIIIAVAVIVITVLGNNQKSQLRTDLKSMETVGAAAGI